MKRTQRIDPQPEPLTDGWLFNENVITIGANKYLRDFEIDGWTCLRQIIDGVVYWPGVRVRSDEFKRALDGAAK